MIFIDVFSLSFWRKYWPQKSFSRYEEPLLNSSKLTMITIFGQQIHHLDRSSRNTAPNLVLTSLARNYVALTNTPLFIYYEHIRLINCIICMFTYFLKMFYFTFFWGFKAFFALIIFLVSVTLLFHYF